MIDGAHIQWLSMQVFGLAFWIRQTGQGRLDEFTNPSMHPE